MWSRDISCPVAVLDLMEQCLSVDPAQRPTAKEIVVKLQGHVKELGHAAKRFPAEKADAGGRGEDSDPDELTGTSGSSSDEGGEGGAVGSSPEKAQIRACTAPNSLKVLLCKLASPFEKLAVQGFSMGASSWNQGSHSVDPSEDGDEKSMPEE